MSATFRETNVQKYTADLASLFRSAIEKGGVKYIVDTKGKERSVWVDRDMWEVYPSTLLTQKIVFNLIGNAFKFTLSGHITVTCRLSEDGHHMVFSVQDTGTGIPSHEINRIFEKFHRVHDQKGRSYEGTGIGLALTQELVKLHGGKIEVESIYGHGTTFTIQIPVGNSHLPEQQLVCGPDHPDLESGNFTSRAYGQSVVEEAGRWAINNEPQSDIIPDRAMSSTSSDTHSTLALQTAQWVPISSRGCRILVADDNEDMRRYVKGVLLQFYDVIDAANGQDALAIAMEERPDMILSDIMMSGLDGFGLLKVIRSSPETRSIPFILLSAKAGDEARVEGLLAGADDYLAKPFNARELIARVHTHLDIARMMTELEKRVKERTKDLMESEARYRYALFDMADVEF
jgi:CheY-like chemotaxis protein